MAEVQGVCCGPRVQQIASTSCGLTAVALVIMSVVLACGVFGYQGKFFIMAACFMLGSIPLFCYAGYKNQMCDNHTKTA